MQQARSARALHVRIGATAAFLCAVADATGACTSFESSPAAEPDASVADGGPPAEADSSPVGPDGATAAPSDGGSAMILRLRFDELHCTNLVPRTASVTPTSPGFDGDGGACRLCYEGSSAVATAEIPFEPRGPGVYRLSMRSRAATEAGARWVAELRVDLEPDGSVKDNARVFLPWNDVATAPLRYTRSAVTGGRVQLQVQPGECYLIDDVDLRVDPLD